VTILVGLLEKGKNSGRSRSFFGVVFSSLLQDACEEVEKGGGARACLK